MRTTKVVARRIDKPFTPSKAEWFIFIAYVVKNCNYFIHIIPRPAQNRRSFSMHFFYQIPFTKSPILAIIILVKIDSNGKKPKHKGEKNEKAYQTNNTPSHTNHNTSNNRTSNKPKHNNKTHKQGKNISHAKSNNSWWTSSSSRTQPSATVSRSRSPNHKQTPPTGT